MWKKINIYSDFLKLSNTKCNSVYCGSWILEYRTKSPHKNPARHNPSPKWQLGHNPPPQHPQPCFYTYFLLCFYTAICLVHIFVALLLSHRHGGRKEKQVKISCAMMGTFTPKTIRRRNVFGGNVRTLPHIHKDNNYVTIK